MIFNNEWKLKEKYGIIAGIDEAGRGPLAGPVLIAAVILPLNLRIDGLNDSKKLSDKKRNYLFDEICEKALEYKITSIDSNEIDKINILQATLKGMSFCAENLKLRPDLCLIDGNKIPDKIRHYSKSVIKGDAIYASISAASVLAKVTRDRYMIEMDKIYPEYGFKKHKGYPTKFHFYALDKFGITPIHRKSYKPVANIKKTYSSSK
jgi:ribonuclease HII